MADKDYKAIYEVLLEVQYDAEKDEFLQAQQEILYQVYCLYFEDNVKAGKMEAKSKLGFGDTDDWAIEVTFQMAMTDGLTYEEADRQFQWYYNM